MLGYERVVKQQWTTPKSTTFMAGIPTINPYWVVYDIALRTFYVHMVGSLQGQLPKCWFLQFFFKYVMAPKIRSVFLFKRHILQFFAHFLWSPRNSNLAKLSPHQVPPTTRCCAKGWSSPWAIRWIWPPARALRNRLAQATVMIFMGQNWRIPWNMEFPMVLYGFIWFHGIWNMESPTGCGPPSDVCWFISHNKTTINYSYIYHRPYLNHL